MGPVVILKTLSKSIAAPVRPLKFVDNKSLFFAICVEHPAHVNMESFGSKFVLLCHWYHNLTNWNDLLENSSHFSFSLTEMADTPDTNGGDVETESQKIYTSPIADPLIGGKLLSRSLKLVRKAHEAKSIRRGIPDICKSIRKGQKGYDIGDVAFVLYLFLLGL